MPDILLNQPLCDWVTITSWEKEDWLTMRSALHQEASKQLAEIRDGAWYQYAGFKLSNPVTGGELFAGNGRQFVKLVSKPHFLFQVSGALAHDWYEILPRATCTRIDIQITIIKPDWWCQKTFHRQIEDRGSQSPYWPGEETTVYIGNMEAERFARIYEKKSDEGMLLRMECVFRKERANAARNLALKGKPLGHIMRSGSPDHEWVEKAFGKHMGDGIAIPMVARKATNTERWLEQQVLPAFIRYIGSHDANRELIQQFIVAIERNTFWQSPEM